MTDLYEAGDINQSENADDDFDDVDDIEDEAGAGGPDLDMLSQLMGDDADPGALAGFPGLPAPGPAKAVVSTNKGTKKKKKGGRVTPPKGR